MHTARPDGVMQQFRFVQQDGFLQPVFACMVETKRLGRVPPIYRLPISPSPGVVSIQRRPGTTDFSKRCIDFHPAFKAKMARKCATWVYQESSQVESAGPERPSLLRVASGKNLKIVKLDNSLIYGR